MRVGWEFCHSMIDDHSRLAYTEIHRDEKAPTVVAFVERALEFFAAHGITARRAADRQRAGPTSATATCASCSPSAASGTATIPPRTPKRNGKVERYQQTLAREWAYGQRYRDSNARAAALPIWLKHYNTTRNHSSLSNRPPISRVRNEPRHDS